MDTPLTKYCISSQDHVNLVKKKQNNSYSWELKNPTANIAQPIATATL